MTVILSQVPRLKGVHRPKGVAGEMIVRTTPRCRSAATLSRITDDRPLSRWMIALLLITYILPPEAGFSIGTFYLSAQRILLLASFLPCCWILYTRRIHWRLCDTLVFLHGGWAMMSLFVHHGLEIGLKSGGVYVIETTAAYVLGRVLVRNVSDFVTFARWISMVVIMLAIFTVPESIFHLPFLRNVFAAIFGAKGPELSEVRHGLSRAYGPFEHPILYGVFCAGGFALAWYAASWERTVTAKRCLRVALVTLSAMMSVSSGPLLAIGTQAVIIIWEHVTKSLRWRWWLLVCLVVALYIGIDMLSNRDFISVVVSYFTFSPETGYWRRLEWQYGFAEVMRHPLIGIGFDDWIRPPWMYSASIDNFWLLTAMRFGLPSILLLGCAFAYIGICLARSQTSTEEVSRCRLAWVIAFIGISFAGATVHLWGSALTYYFVLLGAGVFTLEHGPSIAGTPGVILGVRPNMSVIRGRR